MPSAPSEPVEPLHDLLRHVRRRMLAARAARAAVVATFVVAAIVGGAVMVRLVLGAHLPWHWIAAGAIAIAGVVIVATVTRRRPQPRDVAIHIDSSIGLHELLASAVATGSA